MLKKSKVVALLAVCVMMFAVVEPALAWSWGEWFSNLFGFGTSNPSQNYVPQGRGAYKDIKGTVPGMEAHHIIPDAISPFTRGNGPAIIMTPEDHKKTLSYGNSREAQKFRNKMSDLMKQHDWEGAWILGTNDLKQFGGKYDTAIEQAKKQYEWEITKMEFNGAAKKFEGLGELFGN